MIDSSSKCHLPASSRQRAAVAGGAARLQRRVAAAKRQSSNSGPAAGMRDAPWWRRGGAVRHGGGGARVAAAPGGRTPNTQSSEPSAPLITADADASADALVHSTAVDWRATGACFAFPAVSERESKSCLFVCVLRLSSIAHSTTSNPPATNQPNKQKQHACDKVDHGKILNEMNNLIKSLTKVASELVAELERAAGTAPLPQLLAGVFQVHVGMVNGQRRK